MTFYILSSRRLSTFRRYVSTWKYEQICDIFVRWTVGRYALRIPWSSW